MLRDGWHTCLGDAPATHATHFAKRGGLLGKGPVQSFAATPGMKAPHQAWLTFQTDGSFGFFSSPSRNNVPGGNIWMLSPGALWGFSLRCCTETEDAPIRGRPLWHTMHRHPPIAEYRGQDTSVSHAARNSLAILLHDWQSLASHFFLGILNTLWLIVLRGPARGRHQRCLSVRQCNEFPTRDAV